MTLRQLLVPLLLLALAGALSWWLLQRPGPDPRYDSRSGTKDVDYTISGLDVTRMRPDGHPAHRLQVAQLRHFSEDDTTELEQPRLTIHQDDTPPWEIRADRAWASADGERILLRDEVLITRDGDDDDRPVRIETRELWVHPEEDYAETHEQVRVESESDWLEAVGMQAWLRPPSRLKFLSEVRGHHVPR